MMRWQMRRWHPAPWRSFLMIRVLSRALAAGAVVALAACSDATAPDAELVDVSFLTPLAGFSEVNSSFHPGDGAPEAFMPGMMRTQGLAGPHGPRGGFGTMGGPGSGMMGGGLDLAFAGGVPVGHGPRMGPFGDVVNAEGCSFSEATGDVTCIHTRSGLTITRIMSWKTAEGTAQSRPDNTTNSSRARVTVTGTLTRPNGTTSIVDNASDRTVTGLAVGSTQRTVDGESRGSETTSGINRQGQPFTAERLAGDTVEGVIVPLEEGRPTYPTAGTVTRVMSVTMTVGGNTTTRSRREVITYDGSATATIVITVNGESKTCSLPLPRGRITCG
jgi:hypothetical protein